MTAILTATSLVQIFLLTIVVLVLTHRNRHQREHSLLYCENAVEAHRRVYEAEMRGWSVQSFSVQPDGSWHIVLYR